VPAADAHGPSGGFRAGSRHAISGAVPNGYIVAYYTANVKG
jgi:hypothetical protein